jgi:Ser/Thr protein kinase RdoA (MazF antagonist)
MSESHVPTDRLDFTGDLEPVIARVCEAYGVGNPTGFSAIEVGYEDCNVIIETESDKLVAKMFAKTRSPEDITRYTGIIQEVLKAGVRHPALLLTNQGEPTYSDSGITLALMQYVDGETFLKLDRAPNGEERRGVLEQAAKINVINYHPPYLYDSWAVPNLEDMLTRVKQYVTSDDMKLVEQAMALYRSVPVDSLPKAFVHGDLTKANVIKATEGGIFVVDLSVANWYPRIQELAVIAANLSYDESNPMTLKDKCKLIADEYSEFNPLTDDERKHLYAYALAAATMEFLGSHQEKYINGNDVPETDYWFKVGRESLQGAFK